MRMLVSGIIAGFIVGLASGGDLRRLQQFDLRWWPLLIAGLVARASALFFRAIALETSVLGIALIVAVAIVNRGLPGAVLIALGSLLNLLVILVNGGMPVDAAAISATPNDPPIDGFHVLLDSSTRLVYLADVIGVPVVNSVYSVGDLAVAIGGFWTTFRLVRRQ